MIQFVLTLFLVLVKLFKGNFLILNATNRIQFYNSSYMLETGYSAYKLATIYEQRIVDVTRAVYEVIFYC